MLFQVGYNDVAAIAARREMEEEEEEEGEGVNEGPRLDMRTEEELEAERARKREEREREERAEPSAGERCVERASHSSCQRARPVRVAASQRTHSHKPQLMAPSAKCPSFFGAAAGGSSKRTKRTLKSSTYIDDQGYIRTR